MTTRTNKQYRILIYSKHGTDFGHDAGEVFKSRKAAQGRLTQLRQAGQSAVLEEVAVPECARTKPLPSWIVVSAKDPQLKAAVEEEIARKLSSNQT